MKGELSTVELRRLRKKYCDLPDLYWENDVDAMISPARFDEMVSVVQRPSKSRSAKMREV